MNILESIRKRTGLLVGIVGLALVIFILESLLGSGSSLFSGDMNTVAVIAGRKIDHNEFYGKVEAQLNMIRQKKQSNDIDEQTRKQVIDFIFQAYIADYVIKPEYDRLGITVGEDELYESMVVNPVKLITQRLTDPNTGMVYEQLAAPDGSLDKNKFRQFVNGASGEMEAFLKQLEEEVTNSRLAEKYATLVRKGVYVTTAEAKRNYLSQNTKLDIEIVIKRFDEVSDSAVKVTDDDIKKYYNDNKHKFINETTNRRIEYVNFNISPSEADFIAIEKEAQQAAEGFKGKTIAEDSAYIMTESENGMINIADLNRKTMIVRDSSIYTDPIGTVYGPYNEGAYFKVYKLQRVNNIADSARVRHILIGTMDMQTNQPKRTMEQAKTTADSLIALLKSKKVVFDTLVKTISDDLGSVDKGGDYGWFTEDIGFVEPFKNAGLMGTKGNISAIETQFGIHIIEVLDVSKTFHKSYRVAQIFKPIVPSEETARDVFNKAKEFAGQHNNGELFDKGVDKEKLVKRLADNIKEDDYGIPGLENARDLIRWVYNAKKGEVNLFSYNEKHLVVKLASIKEKGYLPLEDVKDEVTIGATEKKKAEIILNEFKTKAAGSTNPSDIASKIGVELIKQPNLSPESRSVMGVGRDLILIGTAAGTKQGAMSKPTVGETGVFIVKVNKVDAPADATDLKPLRMQLEQMLAYRSEGEVYTTLKEKAKIENYLGRFE